MGKSNDDQIETVDSDQMVPVFSLMCPGISLSTLSHDIRLLDILKFKEICNRVFVTIEYNPDWTDVDVIDDKLVQRTNDNGYSREHPYSQLQVYYPSLKQMTELVGDTDIISSFLEAQKITDVTWVHYWDNPYLREDFAMSPFKCPDTVGTVYQCVPSYKYGANYIWTRYPLPQTGLDM